MKGGDAELLLFLLLDLAIIIVAARTLGAAACRMGQPAVVGEIVAGILLGPTVLGRLFPGGPAGLFPPGVPLRQLADLGLVFFMFLVGLELDPKLIRREGRRAFTISLSGVVAPFALGALIAIPLLPLNNAGVFITPGPAPSALSFSLFMGAAMCITAFPVLARILVERGLYKSPLGTSALCAAAVDDVTAWILLAAVVGLTRSGSAAHAARALGLAAVFVAMMLTGGRRLLGRLALRYERSGRVSVDQVAIVVVGLLISAYVTEWIGIHSIFGAFVFGAIMPHESAMTHELTDKIEDFTVVVLLPVFFAVAGLRTNVFAIDSPELVMWTAVVSAAAIAAKLAGCGVAAKLHGYSTRDSLVLGTLMNTRGLTELVILSIGFSLGVISDRTFAMMVLMAIVTTLMAAPIINRLMPRKEMVRVLSGGDPPPVAYRILVALGNPANARALVDAGVRAAGRRRPAELLLVRLIPTSRAPEFRSGLRDVETQIDRSTADMDHLARRIAESGVAARSISFLSPNVGRDLADAAASQRCDAMLLGWHRPSLARDVVRALVHRVLKLARCDVLVFVDRDGDGIRPASGGHAGVLAMITSDEDAAGVSATAQRLADALETTVRELAGRDAVADAIAASGHASVAVVAVGRVLEEESDFGSAASALADGANCPVIVVRPSSAHVSIIPGMTPTKTPTVVPA